MTRSRHDNTGLSGRTASGDVCLEYGCRVARFIGLFLLLISDTGREGGEREGGRRGAEEEEKGRDGEDVGEGEEGERERDRRWARRDTGTRTIHVPGALHVEREWKETEQTKNTQQHNYMYIHTRATWPTNIGRNKH